MKQVIKFEASWCGPCKTYSPKFNQVASEMIGVSFETIDVDREDPRILEYGVRNVPTTVVVENGKIRKQAGSMSVEQLKAFIG